VQVAIFVQSRGNPTLTLHRPGHGGCAFRQHVVGLKIPGRRLALLDANGGDQMGRGQPQLIVTPPDQVQHLMPVTFPASGIASLVMAAAVNDPGDLRQMSLRALITASKVDIKLDPYWPRLAKTERGAEACG
jgi:hypothetical protein